MPALFLLSPGTQASLVGERVQVIIPPQPPDEISPRLHYVHLHEIEHVVITTSVHITIPLLSTFMQRNIPVIVTAGGEKVLGTCLAPAPYSRARLLQYKKTLDRTFALSIAERLVQAKIYNQRRVIQRLAGNRDSDKPSAIDKLEKFAETCRTAQSLDTLRGFEGAAAGTYYDALNLFFPPTAPLEYRSRRPPHNAVNAVLSYGYTIMVAEMECQLHFVGLDPALGFFHETEDRRPSLALDLIEPFRAPLVDALAVDLFSHKTLRPADHFEHRDGGVFLNPEGKKRFFVAWERRMTREFFSPQSQARTTLRNEFYRAAMNIKSTILFGDVFDPFIMP